jgi:hypothetical protein
MPPPLDPELEPELAPELVPELEPELDPEGEPELDEFVESGPESLPPPPLLLLLLPQACAAAMPPDSPKTPTIRSHRCAMMGPPCRQPFFRKPNVPSMVIATSRLGPPLLDVQVA